MFCSNCGRPTNNPNGICDQCAASGAYYTDQSQSYSQNFDQPYNPQYNNTNTGYNNTGYDQGFNNNNYGQPQLDRKYGLGPAIAAAVLGTVGSFFSGLGTGLFLVPLLIIGLGCSIPAIILGIKSIRAFTFVKRQGGPPPIATLICGIAGLSGAAGGVLYFFIGIGAVATGASLYSYYY